MSGAIPGNAGRNDYPRMIYHPDGRTMVVDGPETENKLRFEGWGQRPHAAHTQRPVTQAPVLSGGDPMGAILRSVIEAVLDERGLTKSLVAELLLRLPQPEPEAMEFPSRRK